MTLATKHQSLEFTKSKYEIGNLLNLKPLLSPDNSYTEKAKGYDSHPLRESSTKPVHLRQKEMSCERVEIRVAILTPPASHQVPAFL